MKKELKTDLEIIAYNCRKATFLIEKKQDERLSNREKLELKLHLAGCYICRVYEQQSLMICAMVHKMVNPGPTKEIFLDDDFKNSLKKKIAEKSISRDN
ncbi:zf-HC2 domain-containing protein [Mucilaginibacter jinjuensis]|uniref:Zinc finger protein n=1 Tax=Mucilaginibacter jinjuensis TaxID=1176721 RepID=A0ABY7TCM3_9SPHI|nr:hypothetical protein [Mucilaginibacter jinjuensis]WCT14265.1 hypothetical protein PQO05_10000 [Mucilaginibacter jinjuensis]